MSAYCHRSLYGYQTRAALALAIENPQIAVTYIPLACSGATLDFGIFGAQRVRECPRDGSVRARARYPASSRNFRKRSPWRAANSRAASSTCCC